MCGGADYTFANPKTQPLETRRVFFPQPHAELPTLEDGAAHLYQWGRRSPEEDPESGLPMGGWARGDTVERGGWQKYEPEEVLIPVTLFSEKAKGAKRSTWFSMPPDTFLMGLKVIRNDKGFLYVVTNPSIGKAAEVHDRMPLVVNADFSPAEFEIVEQARPEKPPPLSKPSSRKKEDGGQLGLFS